MTERAHVETWLDDYGRAWADHDGVAAAALFTDDGAYHWGPYDAPLEGPAAIRDRWNAATADQGSVIFTSDVLGLDGDRAFVHWNVVISGVTEIEGVFVLDFAPDGRCARLQEWYMPRPVASA